MALIGQQPMQMLKIRIDRCFCEPVAKKQKNDDVRDQDFEQSQADVSSSEIETVPEKKKIDVRAIYYCCLAMAEK